ncbi:NifB/NifX family molybdenum-iron cluster-binding protein [uncultured Cohaesibacter sp.]|uniref:NifB/NifX family molybdenum-iron cluster-binding protein n=1 Tax=uncultured Cohaesibacter sp. TaxID=1002546 RepID=UPI00292CB673|nr:NifB/NifX family molybdenum-iron cluster-binding protein [uncultured Cohaesibacter sp.]
MKIAVSSQNFRTVTNHAGRARRFLVYSVGDDRQPIEIERIDLPKEMSMHELGDSGAAHPLDSVDVILSASFGAGFARRMAARSVMASITEKTDPLEAVKEFLEKGQNLPQLCDCNHDHDHDHEHGHGHGHGHEHGHGGHHH